MDERIKFFVGLDAHKDSIAVAACEAGREPARFVGTMSPDVNGLLKLLAKAGEPARVSVVYEAGPTGYGLHRELCRRGYRSQIAAPSLIPRRPGERIKNDRRDCLRLAELSRAGELKAIWVPDEAHEAMRNLWRAREDAVGTRLKSRQQLQAFLLRHGRRYRGKTNWTKSHERWIAEQRFEHAGDRIALAGRARCRATRGPADDGTDRGCERLALRTRRGGTARLARHRHGVCHRAGHRDR